MPVERYPNISLGQVRLGVTIPGMVAPEIERQVVLPLEEAIRDLPGVGWVRCESTCGSGEILVTITEGRDPQEVEAALRLRVLSAPIHPSRGTLQRRRFGLFLHSLARPADQLVDCRHEGLFSTFATTFRTR